MVPGPAQPPGPASKAIHPALAASGHARCRRSPSARGRPVWVWFPVPPPRRREGSAGGLRAALRVRIPPGVRSARTTACAPSSTRVGRHGDASQADRRYCATACRASGRSRRSAYPRRGGGGRRPSRSSTSGWVSWPTGQHPRRQVSRPDGTTRRRHVAIASTSPPPGPSRAAAITAMPRLAVRR